MPSAPPPQVKGNSIWLLLNDVSFTQTGCFLLVNLKNEKWKCQTLQNVVFIDGNYYENGLLKH